MYLKKVHQKTNSHIPQQQSQLSTNIDDQTFITKGASSAQKERGQSQKQRSMKFKVQRDTVLIDKQIKEQFPIKSILAANRPPPQRQSQQQQWRTYKAQPYKNIQSVSRTFHNLNEVSPKQIKTQVAQIQQQAKRISSIQQKTSVQVGYNSVDYRSTKQMEYDEHSQKLPQYVPDIEEKRNKKNDSNVTFEAKARRDSGSQLRKTQYKEYIQPVNRPLYKKIQQRKQNQDRAKIFDIMLQQAKETLIKKIHQKERETPAKEWGQALSLRSKLTTPLEQEIYNVTNTVQSPENHQDEKNYQSLNQSFDGPFLYGNEGGSRIRQRRFSQQRPQTSVVKSKKFRSIREIEQEFKKEALDLKNKLKMQNYHISGNDHEMVFKPFTAYTSQVQTPNDKRSASPPSKQANNMYRTSFQDSFQLKKVDEQFQNDVKLIYDRMKKISVPLKQNEANLQLLLDISKQVAYEGQEDIHPKYENVNKINHIPFADKKFKDILPSKQRFKSAYRTSYSKSPDKELLYRTFQNNNKANAQLKEYVLREHFDLGRKSEQDGRLILTSEVRGNYIRTREHSISIMKEIQEGKAPFQLRQENKELIEKQNFSIKQPEICGGDTLDDKRTETVLHYPFPTQIELNGSVRSTCTAQDFKRLNFKEKMMDQRKTNFQFGSPSPASRKNHAIPLVDSQNSPAISRQNTQSQMMKFTQNVFDIRPSTTNALIREMRKNKFSQEQSKIVLGNDRNLSPRTQNQHSLMSKTNYHFARQKLNNTIL